MEFTTTDIDYMENGKGAYLMLKAPKNQILDFLSSLEDTPYDCTIKPHREKKSLDANGYCWALLGKLSAVLGRSDQDIYRELVPCIGDNSQIVPIKDELFDKWVDIWENQPKTKKGWVTKNLGKCKNTKGYSNTINYYGSSMYDTAQMSRLIELVIQECKEQGIETRTPQELERLKNEWGKK